MSGLLKGLLKYEPALLSFVLSGGLAVLLGNVLHISSTQEAAVTTIATALAGVYAWWKTSPHAVGGLVAFISTITVAATAFGLHLSSAQIGAGAAVLSGVLALLFRQNVTPTAAVAAKK
jgi:hypothetical protein